MPVFLHYCGGQLENINYVIKGAGCCDEDEDSSSNDDCCKDENYIIKNNPNFTLNQFNYNAFFKISSHFLYIKYNYYCIKKIDFIYTLIPQNKFPPPKLQSSLIISTSILLI